MTLQKQLIFLRCLRPVSRQSLCQDFPDQACAYVLKRRRIYIIAQYFAFGHVLVSKSQKTPYHPGT